MASRPFRFGVITYQAESKEEWITKVRRVEQLGYAVLLAPDHFGEQLAAVPALLAAADATTTLRIGSYVFDNDRLSAAQQLTESFKMTAEQVLTIPHCLIGTADQICEALQKHREQFGVSYISIFEDSMEAFAPVVARLTGQ